MMMDDDDGALPLELAAFIITFPSRRKKRMKRHGLQSLLVAFVVFVWWTIRLTRSRLVRARLLFQGINATINHTLTLR
jgi:hypothetical protein